MKNLFKMGGEISKRTATWVSILGLVLLVVIWEMITRITNISPTLLPPPSKVLASMGELLNKYYLIPNCWYSIKLNFYGYIEAVALALPIGFLIGVIPFFRALLSQYVNSIRFLPLTALTGIFIAWFGLELDMKTHFLSFGILIYLLPVIVQRIDEIDKIHLQTIYTLNANALQRLRHVYIPAVLSKVFDDIRVMVAISWTYIIVAELINKEGGVGAMIFNATKQSRIDMVFAILIIIICIGILQDKLFKYMDKLLFPYKYEDCQVKTHYWKKLLNNK